MTPGDEAVTWADAGCAQVFAQLKPDDDLPFTEHEVMCAVRTAYSQGYMDALTEPQPCTVAEAMSRATILELLAGLP